MAAKSKYLNFPIEAADHRKLKLLCLHRDCTVKSILQEIVHSYVENAPEFKKSAKKKSIGDLQKNEGK